jgi:Holliday junction resolvase
LTPEAKVKAEVKSILKELGAWHCMPMGTGYGKSGVPDILCCLFGYFVAIETKAGDNKPTALQEREIKRIKEAGGIALVVNEENVGTLRDDLIKAIREKHA